MDSITIDTTVNIVPNPGHETVYNLKVTSAAFGLKLAVETDESAA